MKCKFIDAFETAVVCGMILLLVGCANLNEQKGAIKSNTTEEITRSSNILANEDIMKKYITDFLTTGYSKYYTINSIKYDIREYKVQDTKVEAIINTTMNSNVPTKTGMNIDTVPYIKEAKEKAQKETDPARKEVLQNEYETMANEYGKPFDSDFGFKLTADLIDNKIDEKSIKLFSEEEGPNNSLIYIPAEEILPPK
ncbi:MAG: hypothetical protein ABSC17_09185 [Thermacetogeniaceae bacterium]